MDDLSNRTAVITGAASGIGLAMAHAFGADGMNLVLADVERAALATAESELGDAGHDLLAFELDVRDVEQVRALEAAARDRFGNIHLLCNNAGVGGGGPVADPDDLEMWKWTIDINLWGVIHGCKVFLPAMIEHGEPAHIVNTASMAGLVAGAWMGSYNVSKYGVVALSETLTHEMQMSGSPIGVSVLCPGFVQTAIDDSQRNLPDDVHPPEREVTAEGEAMREMISALVAGGMPATEVASAVVDAVHHNRFWILTHDDLKPAVLERAQQIVAGVNPSPGTVAG